MIFSIDIIALASIGGRSLEFGVLRAPGFGDAPEAPEDGNQYARKDAGWEQVTASGGGDGSGLGAYTYTQSTGSEVWTISHNLNEM